MPTSDGSGRLEIFKKTWGTICNGGFNVKSA